MFEEMEILNKNLQKGMERWQYDHSHMDTPQPCPTIGHAVRSLPAAPLSSPAWWTIPPNAKTNSQPNLIE